MREVCISDVARYSTNFTPSGIPFVADQNTKLLLHLNEANGSSKFLDSETVPKIVAANGDAKTKYTEDYRSCIFKDDSNLSPALCKNTYPQGAAKVDFVAVSGTGAGYFDGMGDDLSLADSSDWDMDGAFTLECLVRFNNQINGDFIAKAGDNVTTFGLAARANDGGLWGGSFERTGLNAVSPSQKNTWYHFAFTRDANNTTKLFLNGMQIASGSKSGSGDVNGPIHIGGSTDAHNGSLDNIRISKGVARYTNTFNPMAELPVSLEVSPLGGLDFGVVPANAPLPLPLTLHNTNAVPVTVGLSTVPPFFVIGSNSITLATSEVRQVLVSFAPMAVGVFSNVLSLSGVASPTAIPLIGEGIFATIDFDGDGMPDGWELAHGLNPLMNDANDDLDRDFLSNLTEYTWSLSHANQPLNPSRAFSLGGTMGDYEAVTGLITNRFYYDKNDRLIGAEYYYGLAIAYVYDGNNNPVRQVYSLRLWDRNMLPLPWRIQQGLEGTNAATANAPAADPDRDGWSNIQEWRGGSNPTNAGSVPNLLGLPGTNIMSLNLPFAPSKFVVGIGQLDGLGGQEIVVGADGAPGTNMNSLLVLTDTAAGWSTQRVDVGSFGLTSIAIGQPTNRVAPALYLGLRQPGALARLPS
jgi:hypothetical protein